MGGCRQEEEEEDQDGKLGMECGQVRSAKGKAGERRKEGREIRNRT